MLANPYKDPRCDCVQNIAVLKHSFLHLLPSKTLLYVQYTRLESAHPCLSLHWQIPDRHVTEWYLKRLSQDLQNCSMILTARSVTASSTVQCGLCSLYHTQNINMRFIKFSRVTNISENFDTRNCLLESCHRNSWQCSKKIYFRYWQ
jgi:hypothetical protein